MISQLGLTLQHVRQVLWAFLAATQQVKHAAKRLTSATEQQLMVDGCLYPSLPEDEDESMLLADLQHVLILAWRECDVDH